MKGVSIFGIIIVAVFAIMALVAVLMFAGFLPGYKGKKGGGDRVDKTSLVLWGVFSRSAMNSALEGINKDRTAPIKISYVQKAAESYQSDLVNALASGEGPDIAIVSQDMLLENHDRFFPIPMSLYPERDFRDNFLDIAEILIDKKNEILRGIPFLIDPMVMYWNKSLFSSNGIGKPPETWDDFMEYAQIFVEKNEKGNITQAGSAMGEFSNVDNAKDIFSTLVLQAGNPIVDTESMEVVLENSKKYPAKAAENSVKFFSEFSNPNKINYSWNKSLPSSRDMFTKGSLAMYFGFASEYEFLKNKNPHLNFDIAMMPQIKEGKLKTSFGKLYSFVVLNNSDKKQSALNAAILMTEGDAIAGFSESLSLGSTRRSGPSQKATDSYFALLSKVSIMATSWLEPNKKQIEKIFEDMIKTVSSGAASASDAVKSADQKIGNIIKKLVI